MEIGLIHTTCIRQAVYYRMKRQVVAEFQPAMKRATGWRKKWLRWKRSVMLEIRYNQLLFSNESRLGIALT